MNVCVFSRLSRPAATRTRVERGPRREGSFTIVDRSLADRHTGIRGGAGRWDWSCPIGAIIPRLL